MILPPINCLGIRFTGVTLLKFLPVTFSTYSGHEKSKFMQKLIYKKGAKTKKQWYKPHLADPLELEMKNSKTRVSHGHGVRLRQHGHVLYDKITHIINTGELCQHVLEKQVAITSVRMNKDMNSLHVYWDADRKDSDIIDTLLQAQSGKLRSLLISYHVLGRIPHIVFVKDKSKANLAQLTHLFNEADYGPDYIPGKNQTQTDLVSDLELSNCRLEGQSEKSSEEPDFRGLESSGGSRENKNDLLLESFEASLFMKSDTRGAARGREFGDDEVKVTAEVENDSRQQLDFRCDLYGLDRDEMMKKIVAKKKKSSVSLSSEWVDPSPRVCTTTTATTRNSSISHTLLVFPGSPSVEKSILKQKQEKQEKRRKQRLLERPDGDL